MVPHGTKPSVQKNKWASLCFVPKSKAHCFFKTENKKEKATRNTTRERDINLESNAGLREKKEKLELLFFP